MAPPGHNWYQVTGSGDVCFKSSVLGSAPVAGWAALSTSATVVKARRFVSWTPGIFESVPPPMRIVAFKLVAEFWQTLSPHDAPTPS